MMMNWLKFTWSRTPPDRRWTLSAERSQIVGKLSITQIAQI